jgi:hypothetical protein
VGIVVIRRNTDNRLVILKAPVSMVVLRHLFTKVSTFLPN